MIIFKNDFTLNNGHFKVIHMKRMRVWLSGDAFKEKQNSGTGTLLSSISRVGLAGISEFLSMHM